MEDTFDPDERRAIRTALARQAYADDRVRIADPDLTGVSWLVSSPRGLFGITEDEARLLIHGWFFGLCRDGDSLFLFENCALRNREQPLGRIVRLTCTDTALTEPQVLVRGLDANCHQLRTIGGLLCLVDTAAQSIVRFRPDGSAVDRCPLLPPAAPSDRSGAYAHVNSIARIGGRNAVLLHNGKAEPPRPSELAWCDYAWRIEERTALAGHGCHDLAVDSTGEVWFADSSSGAVATLSGRRVAISDRLMTRGIAFRSDQAAVGLSSFGERQLRDQLGGAVALMDAEMRLVRQITLPGPPADILAI